LKKNKKVIFLTGTRADFGKLKPLMDRIDRSRFFDCHVFVTGMHMLTKYGPTYREVQKQKYKNVFLFRNQNYETDQDTVLSNTITGFSKFVKKINPDLIVVHGDRIEALAGAIVGAFNHILVAHIEGGEISGTIDESIRHSVSKLSHVHFVANNEARKRLTQLGERKNSIFIIGSPDIEVMKSGNLPSFKHVKKYYSIPFEKFAIFIFHPVSSELDKLKNQIEQIVDVLLNSKDNFIVIYPNNDEGSDIILNELKKIRKNLRFKLYPSLRFQYFLCVMKNSKYIIGNSSAGVREAEVYGIPAIDIGSRQRNRYKNKDIIHVEPNKMKIQNAIKDIQKKRIKSKSSFGGVLNSSERFYKILKSSDIWRISHQKQFIDLN
jgi:UDP-N-acetylglucosamine 2-epimerase (hydrolysing)